MENLFLLLSIMADLRLTVTTAITGISLGGTIAAWVCHLEESLHAVLDMTNDHELDLAVVKQADLDETVKSLQSVMLAWGLERVIKSWLVK